MESGMEGETRGRAGVSEPMADLECSCNSCATACHDGVVLMSTGASGVPERGLADDSSFGVPRFRQTTVSWDNLTTPTHVGSHLILEAQRSHCHTFLE